MFATGPRAVSADDQDLFAVEVEAGTTYRFDLEDIVKLTLSERTYSRRADFLCSHRTAQVTSCQTMKARSRSSR